MEKREHVNAGPRDNNNNRAKYDDAEWQQLRRSVDAQRASTEQHAPHLYAAPAAEQRSLRMSADNSSNKRLWIHVIEGTGLPDHLKESHITVTLGEFKASGKRAKHETSHPKWGELFIMDRFHQEKDVVIEVKATEEKHLHSELVAIFHLSVQDIISHREIYQWYKDESGISIRVHTRIVPLDPNHHIRARFGTLRVELHGSTSVKPGSTIMGCVIFSANRPRIFSDIRLEFHHFTNAKDEPSRKATHFKSIASLPVDFETKADSKHTEFTIPPGTYFWPFKVDLPLKMYRCSKSALAGTKFVMNIELAKVSGRIKWQTVEFSVDAPTWMWGQRVELPAVRLNLFGARAFLPNDESISEVATHVLFQDRIPASGICKEVFRALYATHESGEAAERVEKASQSSSSSSSAAAAK